MDICETYSNRKLFCNDWEFYKAAFGSDYSQAGTERLFLTKRKRAYALLSALTEFTWTARCM